MGEHGGEGHENVIELADSEGLHDASSEILHDPSIDVLQRVLLVTDGFVVRLLEVCYGERICAADRVQVTEALPLDEAELEPSGDETVLRRTVLLRGERSGLNYVAAESALVLERLDPVMREGLLTTDEPIGRLLAARRVETFRDFRGAGHKEAGTMGSYLNVDAAEMLLFRTYRMISGGRPIAVITEYFPKRSAAA